LVDLFPLRPARPPPPSVRPLYVFHFYPCLSLSARLPHFSSIHVVHARAASSSSSACLHAGANPCLVGPPRRRRPRLVLRVCPPRQRRPWLLIRAPLLPVLHRNRRPTRSRVSTSPRRRLSSAPSPGSSPSYSFPAAALPGISSPRPRVQQSATGSSAQGSDSS
jgi:hypothetical protein